MPPIDEVAVVDLSAGGIEEQGGIEEIGRHGAVTKSAPNLGRLRRKSFAEKFLSVPVPISCRAQFRSLGAILGTSGVVVRGRPLPSAGGPAG
jgi:hypothetical protein